MRCQRHLSGQDSTSKLPREASDAVFSAQDVADSICVLARKHVHTDDEGKPEHLISVGSSTPHRQRRQVCHPGSGAENPGSTGALQACTSSTHQSDASFVEFACLQPPALTTRHHVKLQRPYGSQNPPTPPSPLPVPPWVQ